MKRLLASLLVLTLPGLIFSACSSSDQAGKTVKLVAEVAHLGGTAKINQRWLSAAGTSQALTPTVYKLALVNFWLLNSEGQEVNILNPDSTAPQYTEANPLIIDFAQAGASQELLSSSIIPAATYTGYKMQFLYMEMRLPVSFHLPSITVESDYPAAATLKDQVVERDFRLFFNAIGKFWKRDFVTQPEDGSGNWFWLRREVEDNSGHRNFFIAEASNDHPPGGAGPDSTIDLFADADFWGPESGYSSNAQPIIIGTHSTVGGVDATLAESFTIPAVLDKNYTITLTVDVQNTMLYNEGTAPAGVTFHADTLDLGPGYGADSYGDGGLHPLVPKFQAAVSTE